MHQNLRETLASNSNTLSPEASHPTHLSCSRSLSLPIKPQPTSCFQIRATPVRV